MRVVKDPAVRRSEILDVAQRLVATQGYEQMGVQDILDELQISKGAFYHYFDSKLALLGAVIERMQAAMGEPVVSLAGDADLSATDKLQGFFSMLFGWKTTQRELFLNLLRVWYFPGNAVARQQIHENTVRRLAPLLQEIIEQGVAEQALTITSSEEVARIALVVAIDLSDRVAAWLLADESQRQPVADLEHTVSLYSAAVERLLGASSGTVEIFDHDLLVQWGALAGRKRPPRASDGASDE
jgi:TetR/AcrR family transcriptional regulator, transcriptional repressor for nem operon